MEKFGIKAVECYNRHTKREMLANAFAKASPLVRASSMEINAEFDETVAEVTNPVEPEPAAPEVRTS